MCCLGAYCNISFQIKLPDIPTTIPLNPRKNLQKILPVPYNRTTDYILQIIKPNTMSLKKA